MVSSGPGYGIQNTGKCWRRELHTWAINQELLYNLSIFGSENSTVQRSGGKKRGHDVHDVDGNVGHTGNDRHIFTSELKAGATQTLPRGRSCPCCEMDAHQTKSGFGNLNIFYDLR